MNEELSKYLSDEYLECVQEEEILMQEKYRLEMEQRKIEENLYFQMEEEKRRQLFSPLSLQEIDYKEEIKKEEILSGNQRQMFLDCEEKIKEIQKKKKMLKEFIHSLGQISMKFDELEEEEEVPFFPAFYELVEHTAKSFPNADFVFDKEEIKTQCCMTMKFLTGWKNLFQYFSDKLWISDFLFRTMIEKKRIIVSVECISEMSLGKRAKSDLEDILSKDFYIQSWKEDTFEIYMIIK
ncbi:MAG: hypothetical protein Q4D45_13460 [Lachnospiraceae bacterium]|nr:hypothetical protein [Lachnospiraceae bacterium]